MKVETLMTKFVRTCRPEDFLDGVARVMWDYGCGCVPVLDEHGTLIGIVTDRDICMSAWSQGKRLIEIPVTAAMSWRVLTIRPDETVEVAENIMRDNKVRRLPVVDATGKLVGLLSLSDIAREACREMSACGHEVEGIKVAATLAAMSPAKDNAPPRGPAPSEALVQAEARPLAAMNEPKVTARLRVKLD